MGTRQDTQANKTMDYIDVGHMSPQKYQDDMLGGHDKGDGGFNVGASNGNSASKDIKAESNQNFVTLPPFLGWLKANISAGQSIQDIVFMWHILFRKEATRSVTCV